MAPIDRLAMLRTMTEARPGDPFPHYGLAMELRKLGRHDEARASFEALIERHPGYVPSYLMYGQLLVAVGSREEAVRVYDRGLAAARAAGDGHAESELASARAELAGP